MGKELDEILAKWREAERRLERLDPASPERAEAQRAVDELRAAYQREAKRRGERNAG